MSKNRSKHLHSDWKQVTLLIRTPEGRLQLRAICLCLQLNGLHTPVCLFRETALVISSSGVLATQAPQCAFAPHARLISAYEQVDMQASRVGCCALHRLLRLLTLLCMLEALCGQPTRLRQTVRVDNLILRVMPHTYLFYSGPTFPAQLSTGHCACASSLAQ